MPAYAKILKDKGELWLSGFYAEDIPHLEKAAEAVGVDPSLCVVCEDSISGVMAAISAGMKCVGIRGTYPEEKLVENGAFIVLDGIVDL